MNIERTPRKKMLALNLTPLIDILFILIIFFMLTTSFMRVESLELILPSAAGAKSAEKQEALHIFIYDNGDISLGQRRLDQEELVESLSRVLQKDDSTRIMLLTADGVSVQQLVNIMDRIYQLGGKSLFVRKWDKKEFEG